MIERKGKAMREKVLDPLPYIDSLSFPIPPHTSPLVRIFDISYVDPLEYLLFIEQMKKKRNWKRDLIYT